MSQQDNNVPKMKSWNLALRFSLEIAAIVSIIYASLELISESFEWLVAIGLSIITVIVWGSFNVLDDPSRSGKAPIQVSGWIRLVIEIVILFGSAFALAYVGKINLAIIFSVLIAIHYVVSWRRIVWLVEQ